ncbi:hypothetical protein B0T26DRAFT_700046 [Lasiosphaeria miniovina]|uniref:Zn(2)-C6 fungal-type domain-containing protein n=1 Tax=Lasiosphaeria miniovina TaxID=1954250 RepID=A0AA40DYY8_9PEZI|nr:uncharacterized protein B0T26DRAFT_700046 [Lasiosphaeria miniovina]KAK0721684.1 hypothetical protein B0T26DRAFT_700046 [Lasiosphaeria miniovina]
MPLSAAMQEFIVSLTSPGILHASTGSTSVAALDCKEKMDGVLSSKRRKLNYKKCIFCRKDKKKCEPAEKTWPREKCHRCAKMGLECSESKTTAAISASSSDPKRPTINDDHHSNLVKNSSTTGTELQVARGDANIKCTDTGILPDLTIKAHWLHYLARMEEKARQYESALERHIQGIHRIALLDSTQRIINRELLDFRSRALLLNTDSRVAPFALGAMPAILFGTGPGAPFSIFEWETWTAAYDSDMDGLVHRAMACGDLSTALAVQEHRLIYWCRRRELFPRGEPLDQDVTMMELFLSIHRLVCQRAGDPSADSVGSNEFLSGHPQSIPSLDNPFVLARAIKLAEKGVDLFMSGTDNFGRTLLHMALYQFHNINGLFNTFGQSWGGDILRNLGLEDANVKDRLGRTALHIACIIGQVETACSLVRHGANMNETEEGSASLDAFTPLHLAAAAGHFEVLAALASEFPVKFTTANRSVISAAEKYDQLKVVFWLNNYKSITIGMSE